MIKYVLNLCYTYKLLFMFRANSHAQSLLLCFLSYNGKFMCIFRQKDHSENNSRYEFRFELQMSETFNSCNFQGEYRLWNSCCEK